MSKVLENGCTAVVVSAGFKSGWYTIHRIPDLVTDNVIVDLVQRMQFEEEKLPTALEIETYCDDTYGDSIYYGDTTELSIQWVKEGKSFSIIEEDGFEYIVPGKDFVA